MRDEEDFTEEELEILEEIENEERSGRSMLDQMTDADNVAAKRVDKDEESTYMYTPPEASEIPHSIRKSFKEKGFVLRWLRYCDPDGRFDAQRVRQRYKEGYTFLEPEDAPELKLEFGIGKDVYGSMIIDGDLALAKIPEHKAKARQEYYENMARAREGKDIQKAISGGGKYAKVLDASTKKVNTVEGFAASNRYNND